MSEQEAFGLRQTYEERCSLFFAQPLPVKQFFIAQSQKLASAFLKNAPVVHFELPEQVMIEAGASTYSPVPEKERHQKAGSRTNVLRREAIQAILSQHLSRLEESPHRAVSVAASLTRFTTVVYMVQGMLPESRVKNSAATKDPAESRSLVGEGDSGSDPGELQVPENLLQRSAAILATAARFAPYIVADAGFRQKCQDILGTLVRRGQDTAARQTEEIIGRLKIKAAAHELDRGFSLSLPYFDDRQMEVALYDFVVIPAGRIPFDRRCVGMAVQAEKHKVACNVCLSHATRKHLLAELSLLETAFGEDGYQTPSAASFV